MVRITVWVVDEGLDKHKIETDEANFEKSYFEAKIGDKWVPIKPAGWDIVSTFAAFKFEGEANDFIKKQEEELLIATGLK